MEGILQKEFWEKLVLNEDLRPRGGVLKKIFCEFCKDFFKRETQLKILFKY